MIPLVENDQEAVDGVVLCLVISVATSVLMWWGAELLLDSHAAALQLEWIEPFLALMGCTMFAVATQQVFASWCVRQQAYRWLSLSRIVLCVARIVVQVSLGLLVEGPSGLLWGFALGNMIGAMTTAAYAWRNKGLLLAVRFSHIRHRLWEYRDFALFSTIPDVVQRLSVHLPGILLAFTYNYQVAGWYVMAQRLFGAPQTLLQQAISRVYFGVGARDAKNHPERLAPLFNYVFRRLLALGVWPYLLAMVLAPTTFSILFTASWATAGIYCTILAPMFFSRLLYEALRPTVDLLKRPQLHTQGTLVVMIALCIGIALPYYLSWSPTWGMIFLSTMVSVGQLLALAISWKAIPLYAELDDSHSTRLAA